MPLISQAYLERTEVSFYNTQPPHITLRLRLGAKKLIEGGTEISKLKEPGKVIPRRFKLYYKVFISLGSNSLRKTTLTYCSIEILIDSDLSNDKGHQVQSITNH